MLVTRLIRTIGLQHQLINPEQKNEYVEAVRKLSIYQQIRARMIQTGLEVFACADGVQVTADEITEYCEEFQRIWLPRIRIQEHIWVELIAALANESAQWHYANQKNGNYTDATGDLSLGHCLGTLQ